MRPDLGDDAPHGGAAALEVEEHGELGGKLVEEGRYREWRSILSTLDVPGGLSHRLEHRLDGLAERPPLLALASQGLGAGRGDLVDAAPPSADCIPGGFQ